MSASPQRSLSSGIQGRAADGLDLRLALAEGREEHLRHQRPPPAAAAAAAAAVLGVHVDIGIVIVSPVARWAALPAKASAEAGRGS